MWQELTQVFTSSRSESVPGTRRARQTHLQFRLPNPYGGKPWVTATLALSSTPAIQGDTVRIRAHIDSCFHAPAAAADRAALAHDSANETGGGRRRALARHGETLAAEGCQVTAMATRPCGLLGHGHGRPAAGELSRGVCFG